MTGTLVPGTRLPTERSLAEEIQSISDFRARSVVRTGIETSY